MAAIGRELGKKTLDHPGEEITWTAESARRQESNMRTGTSCQAGINEKQAAVPRIIRKKEKQLPQRQRAPIISRVDSFTRLGSTWI